MLQFNAEGVLQLVPVDEEESTASFKTHNVIVGTLRKARMLTLSKKAVLIFKKELLLIISGS